MNRHRGRVKGGTNASCNGDLADGGAGGAGHAGLGLGRSAAGDATIPNNWGVSAFDGRWVSQCQDQAWLDLVAIIFKVHIRIRNGTIRQDGAVSGFPTQYRVIETTPYKVTLVVHGPASAQDGEVNRFWVLRYLGAQRGDVIGIHECAPADMKDFRWTFTNPELQTFWNGFAACNPELTVRDPGKGDDAGYAYWGEG